MDCERLQCFTCCHGHGHGCMDSLAWVWKTNAVLRCRLALFCRAKNKGLEEKQRVDEWEHIGQPPEKVKIQADGLNPQRLQARTGRQHQRNRAQFYASVIVAPPRLLRVGGMSILRRSPTRMPTILRRPRR